METVAVAWAAGGVWKCRPRITLLAEMESGVPDWKVVKPLTCQPPSTALVTPFQPEPYWRPLPKGNS